jgi:hypothetical protein
MLSLICRLLANTKYSGVIYWSNDFDSFYLVKSEALDEVLSSELSLKYQSFVRKLNLYGFKAIVQARRRSNSKLDPKSAEGTPEWRRLNATKFQHPFFVKDRPDLLGLIKRNCPRTAAGRAASAESSSVVSISPDQQQQISQLQLTPSLILQNQHNILSHLNPVHQHQQQGVFISNEDPLLELLDTAQMSIEDLLMPHLNDLDSFASVFNRI